MREFICGDMHMHMYMHMHMHINIYVHSLQKANLSSRCTTKHVLLRWLKVVKAEVRWTNMLCDADVLCVSRLRCASM